MDDSSDSLPAEDQAGATPADPATVTVGDDRTLAYAEYGDPDGRPVFAFHGVLGSRLTWALCDGPARELGVRVVAPDRPGFGGSAYQSGRALLDWPADVAALADHLAVDRFSVAGFSGGGPHAAACAHALPERVRSVSLVSSVAPPVTHDSADPLNHAVLSATRLVPGFSQTAFGTAAWLAKHARSQFQATLVGGAASPDRELLRGPAGDFFAADAAEGFRGGSRGSAHDLPLVGSDWGFDPGALSQSVTLFHGAADATVDVAMARAFGDLLADCDLHVTDDAHYSTYVRNREAILLAAV